MTIPDDISRIILEDLNGKLGVDSNMVCPVCGGVEVYRCRCKIGDKQCENNHHWAICKVHGKVRCIVLADNSHPIPDCLCYK